jgi:hypothetical protein
MYEKSCFWLPRVVLALALVPLSVGCSKGTISGKVYYQGKPLPGGTITFIPEGKGELRPALINKDGSYQVDRVAVGPVKIAVFCSAGPPAALPRSRIRNMMNMKPPKDAPPVVEKFLAAGNTDGYVILPEHYSDPDQSGLTYDVKSGSQDFDIQLK